jgi:hypothetical protein
MNILNTPQQIDMYRQRVLLKGLKLELIGMKLSRGKSCYSIIKKEYGLKGNKQAVYDQFKAISDAAMNKL